MNGIRFVFPLPSHLCSGYTHFIGSASCFWIDNPDEKGCPMPYAAEITRTNPTCFVFLVDQSSSMREPFGGQVEKQKAEGVADAINRLLQNLILKCAESDGIRDYFYVGVIGYVGSVVSALGGGLAGQTLVPISAIAGNPLRVEQRTRKLDDGAGGILEQKFKFPIWVESKANGRTPMCEAKKTAKPYLQVLLGRFASCHSPLVVNITDGMATDGDPRADAQALRELASNDGNAMLFNAHLSVTNALPIEFPSAEEHLPDNFAKLLFRMSSKLPPRLFASARAAKSPVQPEARGFVFNADLVSVIRFLDIGTRVAQIVR